MAALVSNSKKPSREGHGHPTPTPSPTEEENGGKAAHVDGEVEEEGAAAQEVDKVSGPEAAATTGA